MNSLENTEVKYHIDDNLMAGFDAVVTTIMGDGTAGPPSSDGDEPLATARIRNPISVAYDSEHRISYVTDNGSFNCVRLIDHAQQRVSVFCKLDSPTALSLVPEAYRTDDQHLVVCSSLAVYLVSVTGTVLLLAGKPVHSGRADGRGSAARFCWLRGCVMDSRGRLIVTDYGNDRLARITIVDGDVTIGDVETVVVEGCVKLYNPNGIAIDEHDNLFITNEHYVVRVDGVSGATTVVAGSGQRGNGDGVGAAATFSYLIGIVYDPATGYVYVTQIGSVRSISPAGVVSTLAGHDLPGFADGDGRTARFNGAYGPALERGSNRTVDGSLLGAVRSADAVSRWPPGLAELVEQFARPIPPATALLVPDYASHCIRRLTLPIRR
jgi:hypothetical protein